MKSLSASDLTKRVILRRIERSRGPLGEPLAELPVVIVAVWAKVEAISNRKIRTADQQRAVETYQFTLRPRTDVAPDWQVVFGSQFFTVRAVDRTLSDRVVITAEADAHHDRTRT